MVEGEWEAMEAIPIVDAHVHVWDVGRLRYPWLNDISELNRTFLLEDFDEARGSIEVQKMVFVQCECEPIQYMQEVEWVTQLARIDSRIRGIVSWAPLERGADVRQELDILSRNRLVKGIRRIIQFEEDPDFCVRKEFIDGVRMLPEFSFTFDICISHKQNGNALKLIEQCPDTRFILDHIGKPDIKNKVLEPWRSEIRRMAEFPNVWCKVSSLATEADHTHWVIDDLRPYTDTIFESFGSDRVVFAGDWPVSSQAASYSNCVETIEELIGNRTRSEKMKLFHDNAEDFYGI
jgi:L-fuconolactonase